MISLYLLYMCDLIVNESDLIVMVPQVCSALQTEECKGTTVNREE